MTAQQYFANSINIFSYKSVQNASCSVCVQTQCRKTPLDKPLYVYTDCKFKSIMITVHYICSNYIKTCLQFLRGFNLAIYIQVININQLTKNLLVSPLTSEKFKQTETLVQKYYRGFNFYFYNIVVYRLTVNHWSIHK